MMIICTHDYLSVFLAFCAETDVDVFCLRLDGLVLLTLLDAVLCYPSVSLCIPCHETDLIDTLHTDTQDSILQGKEISDDSSFSTMSFDLDI